MYKRQPTLLLARALIYNASVAKYLILHTNTRYWFKSFEVDNPSLAPTCLSPDDILELYCHEIDIRYLLRLTTDDPAVRDGNEVLARLDKWKRCMSVVLEDTLIQFPMDLISLILTYF